MKTEKTICNEFPFRIYTYNNKLFYLEKIGGQYAIGFESLDAAMESLKHQTT